MIKKLDHVAIAVADVAEAARLYREVLGLAASQPCEVPTEGVRAVFVPVGETELELLEPTAKDGTLAKFLERRGPGLHHLCFEVEDLGEAIKRLVPGGASLVDPTPRPAAHGKAVFLHPKGAGGVLIELLQKDRQGG